MGYDVHITRKENWFHEDNREIPLIEWKEYIKYDREMRLDNYAETETSGDSIIRVESEGLAVWTSYSGHERDGNMAWFDYRAGNITVKNPDDEILTKMVAISEALNAKVQGDDGEVYPIKEVPATEMNIQNGNALLPIYVGFGLVIILVFLWFMLKNG